MKECVLDTVIPAFLGCLLVVGLMMFIRNPLTHAFPLYSVRCGACNGFFMQDTCRCGADIHNTGVVKVLTKTKADFDELFYDYDNFAKILIWSLILELLYLLMLIITFIYLFHDIWRAGGWKQESSQEMR